MNKIVCETAGDSAGARHCFDRAEDVVTLFLLSTVWLFLLSLLGDLAVAWSGTNARELWPFVGLDLGLIAYITALIHKTYLVASLKAVISDFES
jgi:hypothetical protein